MKQADPPTQSLPQPDNQVFLALAENIASLVETGVIGRPTVLGDVNKLYVLLTAVGNGMYPSQACVMADLSRASLHNWKKQAEQGYKPAKALLDAIEKVEAWAEFEQVQNVRRAGKSPHLWAASATHLERRHQERWGRQSEVGPQVRVEVGILANDPNIQVRTRVDTQGPLSCVPRNELTPESTG